MEKTLKPPLRFKGFTAAWEQRKLGEISKTYSGGTPLVSNSSFYNGDIPFIRSGEISSDKTELFLTQSGLNNSSAALVSKGDILYALYGATSGEVAISQINGAINQAILAILPIKESNNFICQWLKKNKNKIISTYLQGGQGNLSGEIVKALVLLMPSIEEETLIGKLFDNIDTLITLHQCKCDKLITLKKALLERMFPSKDMNIPKLRTKGFMDAWEQRKLEDVTQYATSTLKISDSIDVGKYDLYDANSVIGKTNDNIQINDYITIIKDGSGVGTVRLLPKNTSFIGTMGAILAKNSEIEFLYALLQKFDFSQHINGATIPHVYYNEYKQDMVSVPIKDEQLRIGFFFKQFDNLITLHKRKCEKLKNIKKSLLEKMFV